MKSENSTRLLAFAYAYRLPVLAVAIGTLTLAVLLQTPFAYGMDGYYYAAQIKSYWLKGRFFSPDSSPVLYAMAFFSRLGNDVVVMNKAFVAMASAAFFLAAHRFAATLLPRGYRTGVALMMSASAFTVHFKLTYVKNFVSLVFLLLFLASLFRQRSLRERRTGETLLWFILCLLSHKMTAGVALLAAALHYLLRSGKIWRTVLWSIAVLVLFLTTSAFLRNVLTLTDFLRVDGLLQAKPVIPPAEFSARAGNVASVGAEAWLFTLAAIWGGARLVMEKIRRPGRRSRSGRRRLVLLVLALLAANPFYNYDAAELGFRLFLILFVPGSVFLVDLVVVLTLQWHRRHRRAWRGGTVLAALLFLGGAAANLFLVQKHDPIDYATIAQIVDRLDLPENHLLIVHQGFDYYYCYRKKGDAFHFLPEEKHAGRPVYRLAYGIPEYVFSENELLNGDEVRRITPLYTLMPERDWEQFAAGFTTFERKSLLTWRNPYKHREQYIMQKDK